MMNRRTFLCGLTLGTLSAQLPAEAQPAGKVARIGVLWFTFPSISAPFFEALRDGLRELGYVEGQHIAFEQRWAEKDPRRYPELAAELVRLKVDVIVAGNLESARAAKDATATIPIVLTAGGDPLRAGPDTARAAYSTFERTWAKRCPGVVTSLREGGDELLTFFRFPKAQ